MLKLAASISEKNERGATIHLRCGDYELGFVHAKAEHAAELVGLLNAATELLHACNFMWRQAIMEGRGCSGDPNEAEYDRAKAAIDVAEAKGGA